MSLQLSPEAPVRRFSVRSSIPTAIETRPENSRIGMAARTATRFRAPMVGALLIGGHISFAPETAQHFVKFALASITASTHTASRGVGTPLAGAPTLASSPFRATLGVNNR